MLKELAKAIRQALADRESKDVEVAKLASAQLTALSIFALGFLEGKSLIEVGSFMKGFQQPVANQDIVSSTKELANYLEALSGIQTRLPPVIIFLAGFAAGVLWEHYS